MYGIIDQRRGKNAQRLRNSRRADTRPAGDVMAIRDSQDPKRRLMNGPAHGFSEEARSRRKTSGQSSAKI